METPACNVVECPVTRYLRGKISWLEFCEICRELDKERKEEDQNSENNGSS